MTELQAEPLIRECLMTCVECRSPRPIVKAGNVAGRFTETEDAFAEALSRAKPLRSYAAAIIPEYFAIL
jgi:hypothetical protein